MIGEGAFGRVYRGLDRRLERAVAVKVIKPWWAEDGGWVERFQREAQLLARVSDPGIVQIFDIGDAQEGPYYVAELVEGESLAERLRRGPLPPAEALAVSEQLCGALASAHAQGVVHCDVKPANVLLTPDGRVKVGDFGVARLADATSQAPSATLAGTPRYMSPEQARGRRPTPATDVYSAGVVLYEMLAGEPPFAGGSPVELGVRHLQDLPPRLPARVPAAIREVVERALAKDPAERYPDGAAMAAALRTAGDSMDPAAGAAEKAAANGRSASGGSPAGAVGERAVVGSRDVHRGAAAETVRLAAGAQETADLRAGGAPDAAATTVLDGGSRPPQGGGSSQPRPYTHHRPHRRLLLLVAGLVAAGAGLAALLLSGAGARTTVPELRGLPTAGVRARAKRLHVQPALSSRYSAATLGVAIAQNPSAGTRVNDGSTVRVVISAGPPPVSVPAVVGQPSAAAEAVLSRAGLHYGASFVAAPGSTPEVVTRQAPGPAATVPRGSTVALSIAEVPRWRALTTFSGVDNGNSVPIRILGRKWRVLYSMAYQETCTLLVVCLGPSAQAQNLQTGSTFGGFELGEGSEETHSFASGPGLYRLEVSGGHDSARWSMTVEDYY